MGMLSGIQRLLGVTIVLAATYAGFIFLSRYHSTERAEDPRAAARAAAFVKTYGGTDVKILQFYARDANLTEGTPSVICYGVLNAKSVRIDPPVEGVSPSPNRCVEVAPERDTRYTLTAEGDDGRTATASFVLPVTADMASLPAVTSFQVVSHEPDYVGREVYLVSYSLRNQVTVDIDPPIFPTLHGTPGGRFYVAPRKTTTYTLIVTGVRGHKARRQLTINVPLR